MFTTLEIEGLRGFVSNQTLRLAVPNGLPGSGMTILVGANNAGKSTAIEALRALAQRSAPSFTQGRRNVEAGDKVNLKLTSDNGNWLRLKTLQPGGSETAFEHHGIRTDKMVVLPSRRVFSPYFNKAESTREDYMVNVGFPTVRSNSMEQFTYRLFTAEKNRAAFDEVLGRVLDPLPRWAIDQMDTGQYFLKFNKGGVTHSSEGLGEGLVSIFYIIDALYDSGDDDLIAIDEPELSLHPSMQRSLATLLYEYSATRQIIVATHSPLFVSMTALSNGATIARAHIAGGESRIAQLRTETGEALSALISNANNPHVLDVVSKEALFMSDRIVLFEGQEDVIFFRKVEQQLGQIEGSFFGWGVGGAANMEAISRMLSDLGFEKVVGILDNNEAHRLDELRRTFPKFHFTAIPANDIRSKPAVRPRDAVVGLLDDRNQQVRPEFANQTIALIQDANAYLRR